MMVQPGFHRKNVKISEGILICQSIKIIKKSETLYKFFDETIYK